MVKWESFSNLHKMYCNSRLQGHFKLFPGKREAIYFQKLYYFVISLHWYYLWYPTNGIICDISLIFVISHWWYLLVISPKDFMSGIPFMVLFLISNWFLYLWCFIDVIICDIPFLVLCEISPKCYIYGISFMVLFEILINGIFVVSHWWHYCDISFLLLYFMSS